MTNKEAAEILQRMKSDFPLPKAAQTWRTQNEALDVAIEALKAEPCSDTINRQTAIDVLHTEIVKRRITGGANDGMLDEFDTESILRKLPPAQSERKKGYWLHEKIISSNSERGFFLLPECTCSECNIVIVHEANYCPNCGADMRGKENG